MLNNPLFRALIGLDVEGSSALMGDELTEVSKKMKDLTVKIRTDENFKAELEETLKGLESLLPEKGLELLNSDSLRQHQSEINDILLSFRDMGAELHKVSSDSSGNLTSLSVDLIDLQGNIERVSFKNVEGALIQQSSNIYSNFEKTFKEMRQEVAKTEKELAKLVELRAAGKGTDATDTRILELQRQLEMGYGALNVAITENKTINEERKNTLRVLIKDEQDLAALSLKQAESKGQETLAVAEANQVVKDYGNTLTQLTQIQLGLDKSRTEADVQAELAGMREKLTGYDEQINKLKALDAEQKRTFDIRQTQQWSKEYEANLKSIAADVGKLETAYKRLDTAQTRGRDLDVSLQRKQISELEKTIGETANRTLELGVNLGELERTDGVAAIGADTEEVRKRMTALSSETETLANKAGKVVEVTREGRSAEGVISDFIGGDRTQAQMRELGEALFGVGTTLEKVGKDSSKFEQLSDKLTYSVQDQDGVWRKYTLTVDEANKVLRQNEVQTDQTRKSMGSLGSQVLEAGKKIATWGISTKIVYGSVRAFREGIETVKELDHQLTQIAIVQGTNRDSVQHLASEYSALATEMGKTIQEVAKLNTELVRQGLDLEVAAKRAEVILQLSAAGAVSVEQSLQVVTAGVNAMGETQERVADVIFKASTLSASNVEGLGEAFTKTASGAAAAGVSIEETTAMLATMKDVTQEGDSQLGTSLKSMLARFNKVNEETGELNEDLNQVQEAIESTGVAFTDADGQIRSFYDILSDLSLIWDDLDKNTKAYVATQAAGVRQQNRFYAIIDNFNRVQAINNDLTRAAGSVQEAYTTYTYGSEAASNRLKTALDTMWINFIDSDVLIMLTDLTTGFVQLADSIGIGTIALVGMSAKIVHTQKGLGKLYQTAKAAKALEIKGRLDSVTKSLEASGAQLVLTDKTMGQVKRSAVGLAPSLQAVGSGLKAAMLPLLKAAAVAVAIGLVVKAITHFIGEAKRAKAEVAEFNKETMEMYNSQNVAKATLEDLGSEYLELQSKVKAAGGTHTLAAEEAERYYAVQAEISGLLPELSTREDQYGRIILNNVSSVEDLTRAHQEELKFRLEASALTAVEDAKNYRKSKETRQLLQKQQNEEQRIERELDDERRKLRFAESRDFEELAAQRAAAVEQLEAELAKVRGSGETVTAGVMGNVINTLRPLLIREMGEISEELNLLLQEQPLRLKMADMTEEEIVSYIYSLNEAINNSEIELAIDGDKINLDGIIEEWNRMNQEVEQGLLTHEAYEERFQAIIAALKQMTEEGTEEQQMATEALLEIAGGFYTGLAEMQEESIELTKEETAEKAAEYQKQFNEFEAIMTGYVTLYDMLHDAKVSDIELDDYIRANHAEFLHLIGDRIGLEEALQQAHSDTANAQAEAFITQLENTGQFTASSYGMHATMFADLGLAYVQDIENSKTRAQGRAKVEQALIDSMAKGWEQFFKATGEGIEFQAAAAQKYADEMNDPMLFHHLKILSKALNDESRRFSSELNKIVIDTAKINMHTASIGQHSAKIAKTSANAAKSAKKGAGSTKKGADAAKKLADEAKAAADAIKEYNEQMKAIQDATKSVFDFALKYIEYVKKTHMDANDEILEQAKEGAEEVYKKAIDGVDLRLESELEVLKVKEDALQTEKEINEFLKKRGELQNDLVDLEYKSAIASLDTSAAGAKKRRTLEEQLADKRRSLEDLIRDREERLQTEAFARQRQFIQDAADWERSQLEITRDQAIINAEIVHADRLAKLEEQYSRENMYLEAKQATQRGMIKSLQGDMIPLVAAFEELAKHNGEFWTFFGQEDVKAFGNTVQDVLKHVQKLGFETIQQWKAVKAEVDKATAASDRAAAAANKARSAGSGSSSRSTPSKSSSSGTSSSSSLNREFQQYVNSILKLTGLGGSINVDGSIGPATRRAAQRAANHSRTPAAMDRELLKIAKGGSVTNSIMAALRKLSLTRASSGGGGGSSSPSYHMAYAQGGKIEHTGPAEVHGTKARPEYVFNYPQFQDLARMIARDQFSAPKPKVATETGGPSLKIDRFITVEGNIDKDTMPEFKKASENAITQLANKLKGWGN